MIEPVKKKVAQKYLSAVESTISGAWVSQRKPLAV